MNRIRISILILLMALISCKKSTKEISSSSKEASTTEFKESPENFSNKVISESTEPIEKHVNVNVIELNTKLSQQDKELTAKEVIQFFYPHKIDENAEGNESISISESITKDGLSRITLIHDYLIDDSMKAIKYEMLLKKVGSKWSALSLKKNWACWEGRGHTNWGIQMCN